MDQRGDTTSQGNYSYTLLRNQEGQSEPMLTPSAPTEPGYYQQLQPSSQTGAQYYTQPYPAPLVVLTQPQQPIVATEQAVTRTTELSTKLPKYAFVTSVVGTFIVTVLCWLPGLLCFVPATVMSVVALHKNEGNKLKEAKRFSIISFALVVIFAISYPILVIVVVLASVFGYICDYKPKQEGYYYYYYHHRPSYCAR